MQNLRIPYQGSKNLIAVKLIKAMQQYKPNAKYFIDLFGGGGSMSFTALQLEYKVLYNEYNTDVSNFMGYVMGRVQSGARSNYGLFPEDWYKFVSREMFQQQLNQNTPYSEFVRSCYSFGNNRKSYLFGKDIEEYKKQGHNFVVFGCKKAKDYLKSYFHNK